jgi:hypothetical protein
MPLIRLLAHPLSILVAPLIPSRKPLRDRPLDPPILTRSFQTTPASLSLPFEEIQPREDHPWVHIPRKAHQNRQTLLMPTIPKTLGIFTTCLLAVSIIRCAQIHIRVHVIRLGTVIDSLLTPYSLVRPLAIHKYTILMPAIHLSTLKHICMLPDRLCFRRTARRSTRPARVNTATVLAHSSYMGKTDCTISTFSLARPVNAPDGGLTRYVAHCSAGWCEAQEMLARLYVPPVFSQVERLYDCNYPGCTKAYGTLNHLNAHISMQKHGPKRLPQGEIFVLKVPAWDMW